MRILISGSSGLVGSALAGKLRSESHTVCPLVRPDSAPRATADAAARWDPVAGHFDSAAAEGADAVVHLAGASIASGRWNAARKRLLYTSRVDATRHLVAELSKLSLPPRVFLAASAIGYYGDRGEEELTEVSAPGNDFLAALARDWEAESARAAEFGARVALFRFGIILARDGGALPRMLLPFRLGVGGRLGAGRQWMSWIALADVVGALSFAIHNAGMSGVFNTVSPTPVRNTDFTRVLARVLRRPAILPVPAPALRLLLGELADALLLGSQRVVPQKLQAVGFPFCHEELAPALREILRGN